MAWQGQSGEVERWWQFVALLSVAIVLSIAYGMTLIPGVTWAHQGSDSGDLLTAVATGGIAHPPGYPTYLVLVETFLRIPLGPMALRQTIFSAVCAIFAALGIVLITTQLSPTHRRWHASLIAGMLAALWLGFTPLFWSQAIIVEIYSLHMLFCVVLWGWTIRLVQRGATASWSWNERLAGLSAGLALGNHLTVGAVVVAMLVIAGWTWRTEQWLRRMGALMLWISLGLLVYLILPLRAGASPASWGDPQSIEGLLWLLSGRLYHQFAFQVPPLELLERTQVWTGTLIAQFGTPGLVLGLWGLFGVPMQGGMVRTAMLLAALSISVFAIGYGSTDASIYMLPVYLMLAIGIGQGSAWIIERLTGQPLKIGLAVLLLSLILATQAYPSSIFIRAANRDAEARHFITAVLTQAPARAIIMTSNDRDSFALWYHHLGLGERPDIILVAKPLLPYAWYQNNLRTYYPTLQLPVNLPSGWDAALVVRNPDRPVCWTRLTELPPLHCRSNAPSP